MLLVGVVAEVDTGEGADFEVLLLARKEVAAFVLILASVSEDSGVLNDQLRDAVFAAVVVDEIARAELAERDGARPRDELAGGIAGRHEDAKRQPREVVAGEEAFRRRSSGTDRTPTARCPGRADVVAQKIELTVRLILVAFVLLVFVTANGEETAFDGLGGTGEENSGGTVEAAPAIHRRVEIVSDLVEVLIDPSV